MAYASEQKVTEFKATLSIVTFSLRRGGAGPSRLRQSTA